MRDDAGSVLADIGLRLQTMLALKGWTAQALERRARLGHTTVSQALNGRSLPSVRTLTRLADALGQDARPLLELRAQAAASMSSASTSQAGFGSARQRDRSSTDAAQDDEITAYLVALIRWLDADPWTQWFGLPALAPAAIERKLMIADGRSEHAQDADELAKQCTRLVVLGGPGSGKTWLAKRAARLCAETALERLGVGDSIDEVELPLYTTCERIAAARPTDDIRRAVVSSAISHLPDLGGSWIRGAVRALFEERDAPTLLVADSLDEARGADERIRLADTLPPSWRIILTSRPAAWHHQLAMRKDDSSHLAGVLQPLRYPHDVKLFIESWFAVDADRGRALAGQLASRSDLQQAATIPLLLTFYCIIGGNAPLPETMHEVYASVLWHLLSGRWRSKTEEDADPAIRAAILRGLAWSGAAKDKETGIGIWADEILTQYVELKDPDRAAVDHVATPIQVPDLATGATLRRFVHRTIREHLTAEYVATRMTADEAAAELLNHLWHDPDWELTVPAALAMHPERDQVLTELICRAARSPLVPDDLADIDGCWELRRFLSRVAAESRQDDWTAASAAIIGKALFDLRHDPPINMSAVPGWPIMKQQFRRDVLAQLCSPDSLYEIWSLVPTLLRLDPRAEDLSRARSRVLDLLDAADPQDDPQDVRDLAEALTALRAESGDLVRARGRVSHLVNAANSVDVLDLADALTALGAESRNLALARDRILDLLDVSGLWGAAALVKALGELGSDPGDLARARQRVLDLLDTADSAANPEEAAKLVDALGELGPDPGDVARARRRVVDLLDAADLRDVPELVGVLTGLGPDPGDVARARGRILGLLDAADPEEAATLVDALGKLRPDPEDLAQARRRVVGLLDAADPEEAATLVDALGKLRPDPEDLAQARRRVLGLLDTPNPLNVGSDLAVTSFVLRELDPRPGDLARARGRVLDMLDAADLRDVPELVGVLTGLGHGSLDLVLGGRVLHLLDAVAGPVKRVSGLVPDSVDLARARGRILDMIDTADPEGAARLAFDALSLLIPDSVDLARARGRILDMLDAASPHDAKTLVDALTRLAPDPSDLDRARGRVLGLLETADLGSSGAALAVALSVLCQLDPRPVDLARARGRVRDLLDTADPQDALVLMDALSGLCPEPGDLARSVSWSVSPSRDLLAAIRWNSPLQSWLEVLPALETDVAL